RISAEGDVDAGVEVTLEGVQGDGHFGIFVGTVTNSRTGLRKYAHVVSKRIMAPGMGGGEDAVPKQGTVVEETDGGKKLHGRCAVLFHKALEFQQIPASMCVHGHMQILRRGLTGAQQRLTTGLDLGRVEHAPQASLRSAIVGADEVDRRLEPLLA